MIEAAPLSPAPPAGPVDASSVCGDEYYLHERYVTDARRGPVMNAYYAIKPVIPRRLQLTLRRAYARKQAAREFPAWPIESILIDRRDAEIRAALHEASAERLPMVSLWPDRHRFAHILTHDVEGPTGVDNIERVLELERRHGLVSSWNFVAEWYEIPPGTFELILAAGGEVGLHGIRHDGMLFSSREQFDANLPAIHRYLDQWGAVGFRSPATHRNAAWMEELACVYDSSFPDTDPFEPLAGGCCSIYPFMFGDLVELPITLIQDHTLMEILRHRTIDLWRRKSEWLIRNHGLITVLTHPDYLTDDHRLRMYDELLSFLASEPGGWHALPKTVAEWWRRRARLECEQGADGARIVGPDTANASVAWARDAGDRIVFDL